MERVPRGLIAVASIAILVVFAYGWNDYVTSLALPGRWPLGLIGFFGLCIINFSFLSFSLFKACCRMNKIERSIEDEEVKETMMEEALVPSLEGRGVVPESSFSYLEVPIGVFAGLVLGSCISGIISLII